jgi:hypothetical protein
VTYITHVSFQFDGRGSTTMAGDLLIRIIFKKPNGKSIISAELCQSYIVCFS